MNRHREAKRREIRRQIGTNRGAGDQKKSRLGKGKGVRKAVVTRKLSGDTFPAAPAVGAALRESDVHYINS